MQPYFFPYLGYFDLIHRVDQWIVFDTAQYTRHGWVNRNRVLHPTEGWTYLIAPLRKHPREARILDVRTVEDVDWRQRIHRQLEHYRWRAPHFDVVSGLVRDCLSVSDPSISRLNVEILKRICAFLDIPFGCRSLSEMGLELGPIHRPGDWALKISEALAAEEYVNPPGGRDLFDPAEFAARGIRLTIQPPVEFVYDCPGYRFEPSLSILDVLLWNSRDRVKGFLEERRRAETRS